MPKGVAGVLTAVLVVGAWSLACPDSRSGADTVPAWVIPIGFTPENLPSTGSNNLASAVPKDSGSPPAQAENPSQARFNLREGLVGETEDKSFRYHVGGRFDWDSGWFRVPRDLQQTLNVPLQDGTDLRRFRLGVDGTVWETVDFRIEADFSRASDFKKLQSTPQTNIFITDASLAVHDLPFLDTVRVGHQKEYLTFANATSAKFLPFMERPYVFDAFEDSFSWDLGVATFRTYLDGSVASWAGVFWNGTRSQAFNTGGRYAASGRLTWMPIYEEDGPRWLNVGAAGSVRSITNNDPNVVTVRPLVRAGQSFDVPDLIDTGSLLSRDGLQIASAGVHGATGPLTVGGEFVCWTIDDAFTGGLPRPNGTLPPGVTSVGNLFFSGYYFEAMYFLTPGDHRSVNRNLPGYDRVRPVRNFRCVRDGNSCSCQGPGAWEVAVRYDHININSGAIAAGQLDSFMVGLNWYLNPNARVTANYVYTSLERGGPSAGNFDAFGVRVHFDF